MSTIQGRCFVYDQGDYKARQVQWPTEFVAVPNKGDYVESLKQELSYKVSSITHCVDSKTHLPYIVVELARRIG